MADHGSLGSRQLPRAKPVVMTFYDKLKTHPYSATFYVSTTTSTTDIEKLIQATDAVSMCVLGEYTVGYDKYVIPNYREAFERISPYTMGTSRSVIRCKTKDDNAARSHSIPGHNMELSLAVTQNRQG